MIRSFHPDKGMADIPILSGMRIIGFCRGGGVNHPNKGIRMARTVKTDSKSAPVQNPNSGIVTPQIKWVGGDGRTPPDQAFFDAAAADQRKWLPVPPVSGGDGLAGVAAALGLVGV